MIQARNLDTQNSDLHIALLPVRRRLRLIRAWNVLPTSIASACLFIIIWIVVDHLRMGTRPSELQVAVVLLTSGTVLPALAGLWPLPESYAAKITEFRADLKDSLSAALYIEQQMDHPFRSLVTGCAINHLRSQDLRCLFPFKLPRSLSTAFACTCLTALVYHVNLPFAVTHKQSDVNEMVARARQVRSAAQLTSVAARNLQAPQALTAARELRSLADKMQRRDLSPEMALVKQHTISAQLQRLIDAAVTAESAAPHSVAANALAKWQSSLPNGTRSSELSTAKGARNTGSTLPPAAAQAHSLALALQSKRESEVQANLQKLVASLGRRHNRQTSLAVQSMLHAVSQALRQSGQREAAAKVDALTKSAKSLRQTGKSSGSGGLTGMAQAVRQAAEALSGSSPITASTKRGIDALKQAQQLINHGYAQTTSPGPHPAGGTGYTLSGSHNRYVPLPQGRGHPRQALTFQSQNTVPLPSKQVANKGKTSILLPSATPIANARIAGRVTTSSGEITQVFRTPPGRVTGSTPTYTVAPGIMSREETALRQHNIPPAMQVQVRNYFSSLQRR